MKRAAYGSAILMLSVVSLAMAPQPARAIPAFSQQTGQSCKVCHFDMMPRLNAEGRRFRLNAFRDMGTQPLLDDDRLSLPSPLNASLRIRALISNGKGKDQDGNELYGGGVLRMPPAGGITEPPGVQAAARADMIVAGHLGKHVGAVTSINLIKGVGATNDALRIKHFKVAYVWDTGMGPVALAGGFSKTGGAPYIFNDPSNAVSRNLRGWQHVFTALAAEGEGVMQGRMGGAGIYAHINEVLYLAAGGIHPDIGNEGMPTDLNVSPYLRAALTLQIGTFDIVTGGWYTQFRPGDYAAATSGLVDVVTQHYGIDFETQGSIGDFNIGFYLPWQFKAEQPSKATTTTDDSWVGIFPVVTLSWGPMGWQAGYDFSRIEYVGQPALVTSSARTWLLGMWYAMGQNAIFDLEYNSMEVRDRGGVPGSSEKLDAITLSLEYLF